LLGTEDRHASIYTRTKNFVLARENSRTFLTWSKVMAFDSAANGIKLNKKNSNAHLIFSIEIKKKVNICTRA